MKNLKTIFFLLLVVIFVVLIKFIFHFPTADISVIGTILSISSILFGLLAGFFISELWSRYTSIRELQGERVSSGLNMIKLAENFFANKKFKTEFTKNVEKSALADVIINWDEGHLEELYYRDISSSYKYIKIGNIKQSIEYDKMLDATTSHVGSTIKMNILYKERLFFSEWFILIILSFIICLSVLFLDNVQLLYKMIIVVFPPVIYLALLIIYRLDTMTWARELITLEPTQTIFDALGVKRFYLPRDYKFVSEQRKDFRQVKDLKGEGKNVYTDIIAKRKLARKKDEK